MQTKFIGRVGPLAFALGAGVAIALSSPGVALADSSDSTASSTASSAGADDSGDSGSSGGQADSGQSSGQATSETSGADEMSGATELRPSYARDEVAEDEPEVAEDEPDFAEDESEAVERRASTRDEGDALRDTAQIQNDRANAVDTSTTVSDVEETDTYSVGVATETPAPVVSVAASVVQDDSTGTGESVTGESPAAPQTISTELTTVLPTAADTASSTPPAPAKPANSSLLLGLLTWMRKQFQVPAPSDSAITRSVPETTSFALAAAVGDETAGATDLESQTGIAVGSKPYGVATYGTRAYVANQRSRTVSVIDTATNSVISTIAVVTKPTAVAVSNDGSRVFVAGYRGVSVIDTATNAVISTVNIWGGSSGGIALAPDGSRAYVTQKYSHRVVVIDTAGDAGRVVARSFAGFFPGEIAVNPDGTHAYVTLALSRKVAIFDTDTNRLGGTVAVGTRPAGIAVNPEGTRLYVTNTSSNTMSVINTFTNEVAATISVGSRPGSVVVSPDGQLAYVATEDGRVAVVDTRTNSVVARATIDTVSGSGVSALAISPDGKTLYGTDSSGGMLRALSYTAPVVEDDDGTVGEVGSTPYLPFDMPLGPTEQKVFAHYVPWMPISYDNLAAVIDYYTTQLLTPYGENGIHAAYGGYLRDRPLPRATIEDPQWRYLDVLTEVTQAKSVGIDGFTVDITAPSLQDEAVRNLLRAAEATPGFSIQAQADLSSSYLKSMTSAQFAATFAPYLSAPGAFRLADNRVVLSAFYADGQSTTWWKNSLNALRDTYGLDVAFVPTFLDANAHMAAFAPISYGFGNWGGRNVLTVNPDSDTPGWGADLVRTAHELGKIWMQPVAFQDNRPREGLFEESNNSQANANAWEMAINEGAEWVQLVTWNDYAEDTAMAPSVEHGWSMLDMQAYNIAQFKYGVDATVLRDAVYVSHRTQMADSESTFVEQLLMRLRPGAPAAVDNVEVVVFATAAATVRATIGGVTSSCAVGAGRNVCTFDLRAGDVVVSLVRNGVVTSLVNSPYTVTDTPYVLNLGYHMAGGLR